MSTNSSTPYDFVELIKKLNFEIMDILTEKTNKGLHLYFKECGRSVSDFELSDRMVEVLYLQLCNHLFDNLLEQNKDLLQRLKNNEPAPRMINSDKVIEWFYNNSTLYLAKWCKTEYIIKQFKKDFEL